MIDPETDSMFFLLDRVFTIKLTLSNFTLSIKSQRPTALNLNTSKIFSPKILSTFYEQIPVVKQKQKTSYNNKKSR